MGKSPNPCTNEMKDGAAHRPVEYKTIGDFYFFMSHMIEGIKDHEDDGNRFEGAEDSAPPEPIPWCSDPIIMVTCSNDTSDKNQRHLNIKPFLNDLAVHTSDFQ